MLLIPNYTPEPESATFRIYSKAKGHQWNADLDIDWTLPHVTDPAIAAVSPGLAREFDRHYFSDFFYGEQAALASCAKILQMAPDMESRLYLSSQVYDEARHIEVFGRLCEKLGGPSRVRTSFKELIDFAFCTDDYEMQILFTQVVVEVTAVVTLRATREATHSPLVAAILDSVLRDEARHTGFGEAELRGRADTRSPALRQYLEDTMAEGWRIYASGFYEDNPEFNRLLTPRLRETLRTARRRQLEVLASVQDELQKRVQRYGLTLRAEPIRLDS